MSTKLAVAVSRDEAEVRKTPTTDSVSKGELRGATRSSTTKSCPSGHGPASGTSRTIAPSTRVSKVGRSSEFSRKIEAWCTTTGAVKRISRPPSAGTGMEDAEPPIRSGALLASMESGASSRGMGRSW